MDKPTPYVKWKYRKGYRPKKRKYYPPKPKDAAIETGSVHSEEASPIGSGTGVVERPSSPQPGCSHWHDREMDPEEQDEFRQAEQSDVDVCLPRVEDHLEKTDRSSSLHPDCSQLQGGEMDLVIAEVDDDQPELSDVSHPRAEDHFLETDRD